MDATQTINFFNLLFARIPISHFSYLMIFSNGYGTTYPFIISDETQRELMAKKAIELSKEGFDVWHAVNPVCIEPTSNKRGDETTVSHQTAIVVDIDIYSDAHKSDNLAQSFEEAKSFLPFTPSIIINSGYGLHAYYIWAEPLAITDQNREEIKRRNNLLIEVVRQKANGKKIDGVGDLPRILRTPGTFNYKLGKENAPLCHIVEQNDIRFSPAEIDEKLNTLYVEKKSEPKATSNLDFVDDNPDLKRFRIEHMLEHINVVDGEYEKWLSVGMALKNEGFECSLWEQWSRSQPKFKEGECESKWNGFNRPGYGIGTLFQYATEGNYDEKETRQEWKELQHCKFNTDRLQSARKSNNKTDAEPIGVSDSTSPKAKRQERADSMDDLMTTREVADFIGVSLSTVKNWRSRKLFGCYFFPADEKHGDTLYYKRERVEQLKAVYQFGILQNMYKLAKRNPEATPPDDFQKSDSSGDINGFGEELSFRHAGFYKADEVADIFNVDVRTVERWAKSGILKEDMLGHNGDLYFGIDNVLNFTPPSKKDSLKAQLRENAKAQADFDGQKKSALETLHNIKTFDSKTVFADEVVTAGAFAFLFDRQAYSNFKRELKLYGDKHPTEKAAVNDWVNVVKGKAEEISSRQSELKTRHNQIQAQINSLSFITDNDLEDSFVFPEGYSVSAQNGIVKVDGEKIITVCRRPIIIAGKTFSVEEKTYKVILSYMNSSGKWKTLPATSAAVIANKSKIIDLAELGLPVTSSNATHLVDFLDAFNAQNEKICNMTYTVPRCGWYRFNDTDFFIDPRRECIMTDDDKKVNVRVDSQSQFANSLKQRGSIKVWKRAYELAKKSPVARIILAASIASILLKILGERNFLLYIHAPTRAGKTTALYLGASAIGNDKMIRSFDATKNGLAGAAADVNDYAFLVDEKQVADNRLKEAFDNLVYALANGLGRTKLNKDSTLRKLADWRTIVIMTGETQLLADNVTGGANTRLLSIAAPKEILSPDDCKTIRDIIKDHHGLAFPLVIDKILELGKEKLCAIYEDIVETFVKANPNLLNEYCRYMAVIVLADALLCTALANDESKDTQENFALLLDDAKLCAKEIFKLIPTTTEISDTARERDFVLGFIAQNQNRFIGGSVALEKILTVCGQFTDEYIYITVAALKKACDEEGFDYRKLATDLVAAGFFVPSNKVEKGYKTQQAFVQKKIGKANTRCYRIRTVDVQ